MGISVDPLKRLQDHKTGSRWHDRVTNVTVEPFPNRPDAAKAEIDAIRAERPQFNIMHGAAQPREMTNEEFRTIRQQLGFTQAELAAFLGYAAPVRISEFERATNPRAVPDLLARLMVAYRDGYRPADWPK